MDRVGAAGGGKSWAFTVSSTAAHPPGSETPSHPFMTAPPSWGHLYLQDRDPPPGPLLTPEQRGRAPVGTPPTRNLRMSECPCGVFEMVERGDDWKKFWGVNL